VPKRGLRTSIRPLQMRTSKQGAQRALPGVDHPSVF
jgi:hypothetical protein